MIDQSQPDPARNDAARDDAARDDAAHEFTREHLANERTFLAWLRTAVALIALGLAASRFLISDLGADVWVVNLLSIGLIVTGIILMLTGWWRYRQNRREIEEGRYRPAGRTLLLLTVLIVGFGIGALGFAFVLRG